MIFDQWNKNKLKPQMRLKEAKPVISLFSSIWLPIVIIFFLFMLVMAMSGQNNDIAGLIRMFVVSTSIFWLPLGGYYYFLGKSKSGKIVFLRKTLAIFFMLSPIWLPLASAGLILLLRLLPIPKASFIWDLFMELGAAALMIGAIPIVLNPKNSVVLKIILTILYWCVIALPFFVSGWTSLSLIGQGP